MRKIAARLGVQAPSLYWHVDSKEALYRLMSQSIFRSCLDAIPPLHGLAAMAARIRAVALADPVRDAGLRQLIVSTPVDRRIAEAVRALILGQLTPLGLSPEIGDVAQQSVQALVTGWTTLRAKPGWTPSRTSFAQASMR